MEWLSLSSVLCIKTQLENVYKLICFYLPPSLAVHGISKLSADDYIIREIM